MNFRFGIDYYTGSDTFYVMSKTYDSLPIPDAQATYPWTFDSASVTSINSAVSSL